MVQVFSPSPARLFAGILWRSIVDDLILARHALDTLQGTVTRRVTDVLALLETAAQAHQRGRAAVASERIDAALDDLRRLLAEVNHG